MPDFDMESSDSEDNNQSDEEVTDFAWTIIKTLTYKKIIVLVARSIR